MSLLQSLFRQALIKKKTCPLCKNDVYVRTLPFVQEKERVRVAVTEEQAEKIEIAWAKQNGTYGELMESKRKYDKMKKQLNRDWGKEPGEEDVQWHLMMHERIEHANLHQWGLYRNTTLHMGELLYKQKKYDLSLRLYLEVVYLDINGPNNLMLVDGKPRSSKEKGFNPSNGNDRMAPGTIKRVVMLKDKKLKVDDAKVEELFMDVAAQLGGALKLPVSPERAWNKLLKDELYRGHEG